jgi:hypothetical protein
LTAVTCSTSLAYSVVSSFSARLLALQICKENDPQHIGCRG